MNMVLSSQTNQLKYVIHIFIELDYDCIFKCTSMIKKEYQLFTKSLIDEGKYKLTIKNMDKNIFKNNMIHMEYRYANMSYETYYISSNKELNIEFYLSNKNVPCITI